MNTHDLIAAPAEMVLSLYGLLLQGCTMPTFKQQLKTLQDKQQYAAMIALLEASDEPNRAVIIARIQLKMQEAARAEVVLKATPEPVKEPVKGNRGKSRPLWVYMVVAVVLVVVSGIAFVVILRSQSDARFAAKQVAAAQLMANYCERIEAPLDCGRWGAIVAVDDLATAIVCDEQYDWITDTGGFTICLLILGVSMTPGDVIVPDVNIKEWTQADFTIISGMVEYCDGEMNREYCKGWATLNYRDHRNDIWACGQAHKGDQVAFTNCIIRLGVKV